MTLTLVPSTRWPSTYTPAHDQAVLAEQIAANQRVIDEHVEALRPALTGTDAARYTALLDDIRAIAAATKFWDHKDALVSLRLIIDAADSRDDTVGPDADYLASFEEGHFEESRS